MSQSKLDGEGVEGKGRELERRLHRFLWSTGYFVRRDLPLSLRRGADISDIDVFGVRFDSLLQPHRVALEAKHSDTGFSTLLQHRGICDYYAVDLPGVVRESMTQEVRKFLKDLGMIGITLSHLADLEAETGADKLSYLGSFSPAAEAVIAESLLTLMSDRKTKDLRWQLAESWMVRDPYARYDAFAACHTAILPVYAEYKATAFQRALRWLLLENFVGTVETVIEIASLLLDEPKTSRKGALTSRFLGGEALQKKKREVVESVRKLIEATQIGIGEEYFSLDPPYIDGVNKVVGEMLHSRSLCQDYLRFVDYAMFEFGTREAPMDVNKTAHDLGIGESEIRLFASWNRTLLETLGIESGVGREFAFML